MLLIRICYALNCLYCVDYHITIFRITIRHFSIKATTDNLYFSELINVTSGSFGCTPGLTLPVHLSIPAQEIRPALTHTLFRWCRAFVIFRAFLSPVPVSTFLHRHGILQY